MSGLLSPLTGRPLVADTVFSLSDGHGERWPVVDGIAYLRAGSEPLAAAALAALDAGNREAALCLLLAENDGWWDEPPPPREDLACVVKLRDSLSLRAAMALLGYGRVGTYFAHRWSDPTYVAGLALLDAHWTAPATAFELACGIGHYLRALGDAGVVCTGGDIVFSKLWLARHWVAPQARLICFDADAPWPVVEPVDLAICQDAFYFLRDQARAAAGLRAIGRTMAVGHVHNRDWPNLSGGAGVNEAGLRALFPGAILYDDQTLTLAGATGTVPVAGGDLAHVEAFSLVAGAAGPARLAAGPLSRPRTGRPLRRNPLLNGCTPAWPSPRYADEYGARATYGGGAVPERVVMGPEWAEAAARRDLVELPERW